MKIGGNVFSNLSLLALSRKRQRASFSWCRFENCLPAQSQVLFIEEEINFVSNCFSCQPALPFRFHRKKAQLKIFFSKFCAEQQKFSKTFFFWVKKKFEKKIEENRERKKSFFLNSFRASVTETIKKHFFLPSYIKVCGQNCLIKRGEN